MTESSVVNIVENYIICSEQNVKVGQTFFSEIAWIAYA